MPDLTSLDLRLVSEKEVATLNCFSTHALLLLGVCSLREGSLRRKVDRLVVKSRENDETYRWFTNGLERVSWDKFQSLHNLGVNNLNTRDLDKYNELKRTYANYFNAEKDKFAELHYGTEYKHFTQVFSTFNAIDTRKAVNVYKNLFNENIADNDKYIQMVSVLVVYCNNAVSDTEKIRIYNTLSIGQRIKRETGIEKSEFIQWVKGTNSSPDLLRKMVSAAEEFDILYCDNACDYIQVTNNEMAEYLQKKTGKLCTCKFDILSDIDKEYLSLIPNVCKDTLRPEIELALDFAKTPYCSPVTRIQIGQALLGIDAGIELLSYRP